MECGRLWYFIWVFIPIKAVHNIQSGGIDISSMIDPVVQPV